MRLNASVKQIRLNLDNYQQMLSCKSNERPKENLKIGFFVFDIDLNKPIWWNGTVWVDAMGQQV
jgi:hypothetical protein